MNPENRLARGCEIKQANVFLFESELNGEQLQTAAKLDEVKKIFLEEIDRENEKPPLDNKLRTSGIMYADNGNEIVLTYNNFRLTDSAINPDGDYVAIRNYTDNKGISMYMLSDSRNINPVVVEKIGSEEVIRTQIERRRNNQRRTV